MVTLYVRLLQIIKQTPTLRDHLQQASAGMVVFLVRLEMLGEFVDSLAQQRNLDRGRTRVRLVCSKVGNDLFFRFSC